MIDLCKRFIKSHHANRCTLKISNLSVWRAITDGSMRFPCHALQKAFTTGLVLLVDLFGISERQLLNDGILEWLVMQPLSQK